MFEEVVVALEPAAKPWVKAARIAIPVALVVAVGVALFFHRHDVLDPILSLIRF